MTGPTPEKESGAQSRWGPIRNPDAFPGVPEIAILPVLRGLAADAVPMIARTLAGAGASPVGEHTNLQVCAWRERLDRTQLHPLHEQLVHRFEIELAAASLDALCAHPTLGR